MVTRILLILSLALPALAQSGPCTQQFVKAEAQKERPSRADDFYFFSGALEKPVVGPKALSAASLPVAAQRKNEKYEPTRPDRIVASPSGDMAYEYGTAHVTFDEREGGKHVDFTAAYLRVWKAVQGACKVAAEMFEPQGEK